ncbi:hypothetical protein FACS1894103_6090 [Campylobacterota bacterium]|nr:hypothetical protein FACS1894103_6090 [Campylobacterota bacterium]
METQEYSNQLAAADESAVISSVAQEAHEHEKGWEELPEVPTDPEITALREQLFKREIAIIDKLKLMLDGGQRSKQEMDKIIADTIGHMAGRDERLVSALAPTIETVVTKSMQLHQDDFVNILFPLMGPSIRKSIAENFRSMLNSFSQSLETALSWRGLRWRFEALRSGKSFSDVVFLHTIVYRVERVFFIHSQTGLVLSHIQNEGMENQDADMVSGMLTAIGDFAGDCFASGSRSRT